MSSPFMAGNLPCDCTYEAESPYQRIYYVMRYLQGQEYQKLLAARLWSWFVENLNLAPHAMYYFMASTG
jgi:hypothetical protein